MNTTDIARKVFANDHYATELTGVKIIAVGDHEATCTLTVTSVHCNARGVAMGGTLFTLADFAAAIAANSDHIDSGDLKWVSLDANIHFLSPAMSSTMLTARCTALKIGRTTALYQTIIESPNGGSDTLRRHTVAIVETTMMKVGE